MKKIHVIARESIITQCAGSLLDDQGRKALDGYFEGVIEVEDNDTLDEITQKVENAAREQFPNFRCDNIKLIE